MWLIITISHGFPGRDIVDNRLKREKATVAIMIRLYCKDAHETKDNLCMECEDLKDYAFKRLENCKFGSKKPVCGKCKVHCYKPAMREKIRTVMIKSGPKMLFRYPVTSLYHFIDSFKFT